MSLKQVLRRHAAVVAYPFLAVIGSTSLTNCGAACTTFAAPALVVEITDARTGEQAAIGSTIIVIGRSFRDSVTFHTTTTDNTGRYIAYEPGAEAGPYAIEVRKPGFETWKGFAVVREEDCHVITTHVSAELISTQ